LQTLRPYLGNASGVLFSPDGRRLIASCQDTLRVWDAATHPHTFALEGHASWVAAVAFSPDDRYVATGSGDQTVKLWDANTGREVLCLQGHTRGVVGVAISADGRRLASASDDGTVRVWDAASGKMLHVLEGHTGPVWRVAISPDGKRLASASQDGSVRVWDAGTGQPLRSFEGHTGGVWGVAFSPDGRRLAFASGDANHLHSGHTLPTPLAPAPRGNQTVKVWDVATGRETLCLRGNSGSVFDVAFSPNGRRLAAAGTDTTVRLWDTATGHQTQVLQQRNWGRAATFSPDGRRVVSGGVDGTVKLWDADNGQELLALKGHVYPVNNVAFSRDGRKLASASTDGTVKIWEATDLTPERRIEYEARGLVQWLFAKPLPPDEVANAVRNDGTVTEAVRRQAREWVEPRWRIQVHAEAARTVGQMFAKGLLRSEVRAALDADARLRPAVRKAALALAETLLENAQALDHAGWQVVQKPGAGAAAYEHALPRALASARLAGPNRYPGARGVAYYRLGKYREALDALAQAIKVKKANPMNLPFLAMTQHQLGLTKESQATLAQLRQVLRQPEWAMGTEYQEYLREAEELLLAKPASPKR
jgi:WD40 repeat protein